MTSQNRDKAESVLSLAHITDAPVDLVEISKVLNIKIEPFDFPDKRRGMVYLDEKLKVIGVNKNNPVHMQRYTIAHELGHYLNGHEHYEKIYTDEQKLKYADPHFQQEREADMFAAELLMPKEFLIRDLGSIGFDTKKLMEKYQVSEQALIIRLTSLNLSDKYINKN